MRNKKLDSSRTRNRRSHPRAKSPGLSRFCRKWYLLLLLTLSSCGYQLERSALSECYRSICVPYVEGDHNGLLTTALIRTLTTSGTLAHYASNADLILNVRLLPLSDMNIGFAYAPENANKNSGHSNSLKELEWSNRNCKQKFSNILVANEARLTLTAIVTLQKQHTHTDLIVPFEVSSSLTYDFEPDLSDIDAHTFSLGQLDMHNLAYDAAMRPLYTLLAEKIVDYINHCW